MQWKQTPRVMDSGRDGNYVNFFYDFVHDLVQSSNFSANLFHAAVLQYVAVVSWMRVSNVSEMA